MDSHFATRIVECSLSLGSAASVLPLSPCLNSPRHLAGSTAGKHAARRATLSTHLPTSMSAGFLLERLSDACRSGEAPPRSATSVAKPRTVPSSASRMRASTAPSSGPSASHASPSRPWHGTATTLSAPTRTAAGGTSGRPMGSLSASTKPCSQRRAACALSAATTSRTSMGARARSSSCPWTTITRLAQFAACSARNATGQSACSATAPTWYRRRPNTFCTIETRRLNSGGLINCPPLEIGGQ